MTSRDPEEPDVTRDLVDAARRDRTGGFTALYERVAPALYAWAALQHRREGSVRVDPDDLIQEVFVRALAKFDGFDQETRPFRAWIFRIAKNILLEAHRRSRETSVAPVGSSNSQILSLDRYPDDATSITKEVCGNEAVRQLITAAQTLTDDERELLLDCGLEGRPLGEVAMRMDVTTEAIKKRWQRLRAQLWARGPFAELI